MPTPNFKVETLPDGKLQFTLLEGDNPLSSFPLTADSAGGVAVLFLRAASRAWQATGSKPLPSKTQLRHPSVAVSRIGLVTGSKPQNNCILFEFGEAAIAVEIPNEGLKELAQMLTTLLAGGSQH